ncbi:LysR family glycine cleavage system transcriptional activator [Sphingobium sp. B2D3A]|uniref:LysR substrate-binding domain-containing protein n=1 Tax=Sphingobium TaxID=165695 RepID=UPI0015EB2A90|nr:MULTISPECIES: LysR substrate-binding domain-containing protein [Sphingobium]MCW2336931.1 LysR family glycine cleavage system transcriptional activator [Sphingobium sp. B2D3A]MCW2351375.1 LysR family glycine cleavage system transcriptional activator [Sphingobium sp. B12D2B]MCW2362840.1 LysR family glycine cleavage system transcriptional activator [Sphingobium sp. B10D3B]MCW2365325.1 LysR family glycine cleavage system transcriptional activator [Sphingobium sp. B7D2B]MCW2386684.1 LysR family 
MRRLPPLTALEAFVQVARTGSVKAAAEELALSAPALSRRIQALERFLGYNLFERKHQQLELNQNGHALIKEIAPALDALGAAIESATGGARTMRVRLGMLPLFASQRLFPRLGELHKQHPDLHLDVDTSPNAIARLGEGLDAAIVLARDVDPSLYGRELDRDLVYLIGSKTLLEGPRPVTRPEDIARQTLLVHRDMSATFDVWKEAVGLPNLTPASIDYYDSGALMLEAAAQGLGIAAMHGRHFKEAHDPRIVRLFDYHVESPYRYFFVCRPKAMEKRAVRMFHDWVINAEI